MTDRTSLPSPTHEDADELKAELTDKMGEDAATYAKVRASAAAMRGATGDARQWEGLAREVSENEGNPASTDD